MPRDWVNTFNYFPSNGLTGFVYGSNAQKQFDIRIRPVGYPVQAEVQCLANTWSPTTVSSGYGVQTLGTCQFADPGIAATACPLAFPPNLIEDQFYGACPGGLPCLTRVAVHRLQLFWRHVHRQDARHQDQRTLSAGVARLGQVWGLRRRRRRVS